MDNILITGMSGGLSTLIASFLMDKHVIYGVDFRPYPSVWPFKGKFYQIQYGKRKMADIFQEHDFKTVLHMGRIGTPVESFTTRYRLNVLGTKNILRLCEKYNVQQIIIFSTYHVYGAHPHNNIHIDEETALRASLMFHELYDAVELDNLGTTYLWKNRNIKTIVIRPCNIVGPHISNTISQFLRRRYIPCLMGYDPMMQFIHEEDIAAAVVKAINSKGHGVYNIAGPGAIPYRKAIDLVGGICFPVPHPLADLSLRVLEALGTKVPLYLIDYFRYPSIISDRRFREDFGFAPKKTIRETFEGLASPKPIEIT